MNNFCKRRTLLCIIVFLGICAILCAQTPYDWNNSIPEKTPDSSNDNGKLVLFDVSHGATCGSSDWVLDGAFSDFADALVEEGYTVREYRGVDKNGDGVIRFYDDRQEENVDINEAIITYDAIKDADVFVMAEPNRPLTLQERDALIQFVDSGKGLYLISDHYNADRNYNTWDSTEVFNGYNRSNDSRYNLGGLYGDLRNPQTATGGWLAPYFGVRFRFNAIDCKGGVSDVCTPGDCEGITTNVGSILMAGGCTLAITDGNLAKGLVYLANNDNASPWSHSVDDGVYFPGQPRFEGPYVAISKPSLGKAAFIGDSSPIEDATPKYKREDGGTKSTYPGWTDSGNAAVLSINIVNWLATQESYVGFAGRSASGTNTPVPMHSIETYQPENEPWSMPSYDPWDTDTFTAGSYGAPYSSGGGSSSGTLTVAEALAVSEGTAVTVTGYVVAAFNDQYGLELSDTQGGGNSLVVKIPSHFRATFNPELNPAIVGTKIVVSGQRGLYALEEGIISVSNMEID